MITCSTYDGSTKQFPKEQLTMRPACYGVVIHNNSLLLVKSNVLQKWIFPGGGVDKGETLHDALVREVYEETGIMVTHPEFLTFREGFFYFPLTNEPFQTYRFFYRCTPKGNTDDIRVIFDEDVTEARWIPLGDLPAMMDDITQMEREILTACILQK